MKLAVYMAFCLCKLYLHIRTAYEKQVAIFFKSTNYAECFITM